MELDGMKWWVDWWQGGTHCVAWDVAGGQEAWFRGLPGPVGELGGRPAGGAGSPNVTPGRLLHTFSHAFRMERSALSRRCSASISALERACNSANVHSRLGQQHEHMTNAYTREAYTPLHERGLHTAVQERLTHRYVFTQLPRGHTTTITRMAGKTSTPLKPHTLPASHLDTAKLFLQHRHRAP
eukprot:365495-Chlamydomonas_euryale.AAC.17